MTRGIHLDIILDPTRPSNPAQNISKYFLLIDHIIGCILLSTATKPQSLTLGHRTLGGSSPSQGRAPWPTGDAATRWIEEVSTGEGGDDVVV